MKTLMQNFNAQSLRKEFRRFWIRKMSFRLDLDWCCREGANRKFFWLESDKGTMPVPRRTLDKTSYLRKLVGYAHTYRHELHAKRYNLPNVRVLTVTPGRQRIGNIIAAYRE